VDGELPDRFMMAVQAIRGDFSPEEGAPDDEHQDDLLLQALVKFPATVEVRVVSRPVPAPHLQALEADIAGMLRQCVEAVEDEVPQLSMKERGSRRSFSFSIKLPSANALAELRSVLNEDPRVQMVF